MDTEQEKAIDSTLQSLYNVMKTTPAVAFQCFGRFPCLFRLLESSPTTGHLALQVKYFIAFVCRYG